MNSPDCFALLDDNGAHAGDPCSRLYTGHAATLHVNNGSDLPAALAAMQQALQQGQYAVWVFDYEFGAELQHIAAHSAERAGAHILLFNHCRSCSASEVSIWLNERSAAALATVPAIPAAPDHQAGVANIHADVSEAAFHDAIAQIHAYIEAGDTYQVNYTYRLHFDAYGSPYALYLRLRARQPVPYGALIGLDDGRMLLSLSPELFVRHDAGNLTARPMKGTVAASDIAEEETQRATALAADPKNRAENLMIVDLLRNDLSRIAALGSVSVPHLFEVNRYGNVLQMTSTVQARLRDGIDLAAVVTALYPCGSITGAPKRRTMEIIRELEHQPRGFYTGAIGWFDPPAAEGKIGDFCLSVPIRTLVLQAPAEEGIRRGEMGIGAGIVHDSDAADEYAECQLKARFLTGLPVDFELFETMHATRADGCRYLQRHLQRLATSAAYFGFSFDAEKIHTLLRQTCSTLDAATPHRVRLALNQAGLCTIQSAPLQPCINAQVLLAASPTWADDLFLRHKSTVRQRYDAAWRQAEAQGAFDMLFYNERNELTEGARSNLFVKLAGRWYTPPQDAGILPGIMRAVILDDPAWNASERRLMREDLLHAEEIMVCNALRGALPVTLAAPVNPMPSASSQ